jgi:tellurite resistance protein
LPEVPYFAYAARMTTAVGQSDVPARARFDYLPIGFFGSVMGLCGLSVAWHLAHERFGVPVWIADVIGAVAVAAFVLLAIGYIAKTIVAPDAVRKEFAHPIIGSLFGTIFISLLLLPIILAPLSLITARVVWVIGATGMMCFAWIIVNRWMSDRQQVVHATPAWIVPVVGTLDVPLAVPSLGLPPMHGIMVLALAIGLFFTIPIFTLIFSRLLFEEPLPDALQPTLLILVAPFAVGFSSYVVTAGTIDLFAQGLFALTLFLLAVLIVRMRRMLTCCPFRFSWWAISFPLAASAIAGIRVSIAVPNEIAAALALLLLAGASIVIAMLLGRTLIGLARGEMRALSA